MRFRVQYRITFLVLQLIHVFFLACNNEKEDDKALYPDGGGGSPDGGRDGGSNYVVRKMQIMTFNAGIAFPVIPYSKQRAPLVVAELTQQPIDVLCVQEFWEKQYWDELVQETKEDLPYELRRQDEPSLGGGNCSGDEVAPLIDCIESSCQNTDSDDLAGCVLEKCTASALVISDSCFQCLYANIQLAEVDAIREACVVEGNVNTEATRNYAYNGSFGTGLLSTYRLEETDSILLPSTMTRRNVLYALLPDTPIGKVHVFCMHLTALLSLPYSDPEGEFDSYSSEQSAQIEAMLSYVEEKAARNEQIILMGDFNTSPEINSIQPELPDNYQTIINAGYWNPYTEQKDLQCTFCGDNFINAELEPPPASVLIDHILIKNIDVETQVQQVMREPIVVSVDGKTIETAYSDHFGLILTLGSL